MKLATPLVRYVVGLCLRFSYIKWKMKLFLIYTNHSMQTRLNVWRICSTVYLF